jgi:hypothetical protein
MVRSIPDSFPIEVSDEIKNWQLLILMGLDILMTCGPAKNAPRAAAYFNLRGIGDGRDCSNKPTIGVSS